MASFTFAVENQDSVWIVSLNFQDILVINS